MSEAEARALRVRLAELRVELLKENRRLMYRGSDILRSVEATWDGPKYPRHKTLAVWGAALRGVFGSRNRNAAVLSALVGTWGAAL